MALASEDIWNNVDMDCSSSNIDLLLDCVADNSALRLARSLKDETDSLVPDIADIMIDTGACLDIGIDLDFDHFLDDILRLEEEEPLRQDCMWSGQDGEYSTNLGEQLLRQQKKEAKPRLDTLPTADLADIASKDLSCFDTPLSSETSDLDETSSDLEAEAEATRSKVDIMFSDHCYTSCSPASDRLSDSLLTPNDSSEEDEVKQTKPTTKHIKSFQPVNTFRVPSFPTPRLKQDASLRSRRQPKFKFHMKFKPTTSTNTTTATTYTTNKNTSLTARSLLRQNGGLLGASKKKSLIKSSLIPYSSKSIQVRETRVVTGGEARIHHTSTAASSSKPSNVRDLHNSLERQRRIDLRNAFDTLRQSVPELRAADKASKLLILNKSRDYCWKLASREASLSKELKALKVRQANLVRQLKQK